LSILVFPIFVRSYWYGFIGFDDTQKARRWKEQDVTLLQTGAEIISSYLERNESARALRKSEERYRNLFQGAAEGIMVVDSETMQIRYANRALCDMLGYSEDEFKKLSIPDIHPKEDRESIVKEFNLHVSKEKKLAANIPCLKKDGTLIYVDIVTAIEYIDGRRCNIGFFTDVTARRQADEELRKAHGELENRAEQWTNELGNANKKLVGEIGERQKAESKLLIYHDQLRSMTSKLSLAEERLRRRMAIDIHDNVGQDLAIAKMKTEALAAAEETVEFKKELTEISGLLAQTIKNTRSLTFELSPPVLYELGFEAAVNWLVRQTMNQYGFSAKFSDDKKSKPLENDVRVILFQAVKEVLFNIAKHAKAQNVAVTIKRAGDEIKVEIVDDGKGFDVAEVLQKEREASGFGLFSIRERLDYVGGRININSKPNRGTYVTLFAPVENNQHKSEEGNKE
jgi:PAS domain S-box-containing protein